MTCAFSPCFHSTLSRALARFCTAFGGGLSNTQPDPGKGGKSSGLALGQGGGAAAAGVPGAGGLVAATGAGGGLAASAGVAGGTTGFVGGGTSAGLLIGVTVGWGAAAGPMLPPGEKGVAGTLLGQCSP